MKKIAKIVVLLLLNSATQSLIASPLTYRPSIHGEYSLLGAAHFIGGEAEKSALQKGQFLTNELKLKIDQSFKNGWTSASNLHIRKTPDPQIDVRRDVRLLGYTVELYNPTFHITGGELFADFSQYTMNQALEGVQMTAQTESTELKLVTGSHERDEAGNHVKNWVMGGRSQILLLKEFGFAKDWKVGFNFSVEKSSNLVCSINNHLLLWDRTALEGEFAKSWIDIDKNSFLADGGWNQKSGSAVRLNTITQFSKKAKMKLDYEWVSANFTTLNGSAVPDKVNVKSYLNYKWSKRWSSETGYRISYDKLSQSLLTKRTFTHVPGIAFYWTPMSESWLLSDFFSKMYWEMRRRISEDNPSSQIDFLSNEYGVENSFKIKRIGFNSGAGVRTEKDSVQRNNDRVITNGFIGLHLQKNLLNATLAPTLRWQFSYEDKPNEGGRDFVEMVFLGLDLDISNSFRFEQRYSMETASRAARDSDTVRLGAYIGLDYNLWGKDDYLFKFNYERANYAHPSNSEHFSEDNFQAQFLLKF